MVLLSSLRLKTIDIALGLCISHILLRPFSCLYYRIAAFLNLHSVLLTLFKQLHHP